jgi:hypothetical protein
MIEAGSVKAARERVGAILDGARYVDLSRLIVGRADPEIDEARRAATVAGDAAGRTALVREARQAATSWVLQAFSQRGYSGTWAATEVAVSVARPADRTAVAEALADAVTAAAVEDLVDAETVDALRSRWDVLDASSAIPEPGALNDLTSSLAETGVSRAGRWSLLAGVVLLLVGVAGLATGTVLGIALFLAGVVVVANSLRGR